MLTQETDQLCNGTYPVPHPLVTQARFAPLISTHSFNYRIQDLETPPIFQIKHIQHCKPNSTHLHILPIISGTEAVTPHPIPHIERSPTRLYKGSLVSLPSRSRILPPAVPVLASTPLPARRSGQPSTPQIWKGHILAHGYTIPTDKLQRKLMSLTLRWIPYRGERLSTNTRSLMG
jgi:hypothetical protein